MGLMLSLVVAACAQGQSNPTDPGASTSPSGVDSGSSTPPAAVRDMPLKLSGTSTWADTSHVETQDSWLTGTWDIKVSGVTLELDPEASNGETAEYIITSATITVSGTSYGRTPTIDCDMDYGPTTVTLTNADAADGSGPKLRGGVSVNLKAFALLDGNMYPARAYTAVSAADVQLTQTATCETGGTSTGTYEYPSLPLFKTRSTLLDDTAPIFVMSEDGTIKGSDSSDSFHMAGTPSRVNTSWDFKVEP